MADPSNLTPLEWQELLQCARTTEARASLRAVGARPILGNLRVVGVEPGRSLCLAGAKARDGVPREGVRVSVAILLGERIVGFQAQVLAAPDAGKASAAAAPVLHLGWPGATAVIERREDARVTLSGRSSLNARERPSAGDARGQVPGATGAAVDAALRGRLGLGRQAQTQAMGHSAGRVRPGEGLDVATWSARLDLALGCIIDGGREALRRFRQIRGMGRLVRRLNGLARHAQWRPPFRFAPEIQIGVEGHR